MAVSSGALKAWLAINWKCDEYFDCDVGKSALEKCALVRFLWWRANDPLRLPVGRGHGVLRSQSFPTDLPGSAQNVAIIASVHKILSSEKTLQLESCTSFEKRVRGRSHVAQLRTPDRAQNS